jgi:glutathionylspermidine amidase/synthetase
MTHPVAQPFGTLLGYAPGHVPVYSSDYETASPRDFTERSAYHSYIDGVFMGYKWQCVEFARRWLYLNHGYIFEDVPMAYDIFELRHVRVVETDALLPLRAFTNGSPRPPEPGSMLIWEEGGEFQRTGHIAIITEVHDDHVCIAEQNLEHELWPTDQSYSRTLTLRHDAGRWHIEQAYEDVAIKGWLIQTDDDTHAVPAQHTDPRLLDLKAHDVPPHSSTAQGDAWLDVTRPAEAAYVDAMSGHLLTQRPDAQRRYIAMSHTAETTMRRATNELHALFMFATREVLKHDDLLERFNIPPILWQKLHDSWNNRANHMITGRFDFTISAQGIKTYEYNADSASCYFEAAVAQGKWAAHTGLTDGEDPGEQLSELLTQAWSVHRGEGLFHIMQDHDKEESYHALYMKSVMEAAHIPCKIIRGLDGLRWGADGEVLDAQGTPITHVWKTWAWETALEQIRRECDEEEQAALIQQGGVTQRPEKPRLVDVLLRPDVRVFEPFWTIIPSNKAILAVLWDMFPDHPYLLQSHHDLNDALRTRGYVTKPIGGRCGLNITVVDSDERVMEDTQGKFAHQEQIYQELFALPIILGDYVQLCTFTAQGEYAGACVRADPSVIIGQQSDVLPLRVLDDDLWLTHD